ncbi:MAG: hypothetical protein ONB17_08580 [candidate division KSB1 bacterium]|nr:hypothetical protein [candidate division KSB1 bacterium]
MPRSAGQAVPAAASGAQQYTKLENRVVLLTWLNSLLVYRSNRELLEDCKGVAEGFGADGRSFLYHHLIARGSQVKIPADDLDPGRWCYIALSFARVGCAGGPLPRGGTCTGVIAITTTVEHEGEVYKEMLCTAFRTDKPFSGPPLRW